jgi:CrcB-like protein
VRAVVAVDVPRTLLVNVVGAFLLGLLLGHLAQVEQTLGRRRLRLLAGTGFMGGLTTYSTFVLQVDHMGWAGVGYAALSLGAGLVAAGVGLAVARRTA